MPQFSPLNQFTRRHFLQWSGLSGTALFLSSCSSLGNRWNAQIAEEVGNATEPINERIEALLLKPQTPVPEFPISAIQPDQLLINTFDQTPMIDPQTFQLIIEGAVSQPLALNLKQIQQLPFTSMVIRHVCVEGWAAIVQWGGVRLRDVIALTQPQSHARYVYFQSADGYFESWDIASALHPQTLLAYQKNGQPLPIENGAPLRLAAPIKLGYKQSKWVTRIILVDRLLPQKGYWEDQGYEWFGGL